MAKVTGNVALRDPATGAIVVLNKGDTVPEWADGLVGPHLLDGADVPTKRTSGVPPKGGSGRDVPTE